MPFSIRSGSRVVESRSICSPGGPSSPTSGAKRQNLRPYSPMPSFAKREPQRSRSSHGTARSALEPEAQEFLTARELEAWLKIDRKTIYSYVQRGLIPYLKIQSNIRFRREDILERVDQHRVAPRTKAS